MYTEKELGQMLRNKYENAPRNEQVLMIHLFGIEFRQLILDKKYKIANIIYEAGINESYKTELSKGVKLGKYVEIKSDKKLS